MEEIEGRMEKTARRKSIERSSYTETYKFIMSMGRAEVAERRKKRGRTDDK